MDTTKRTDGVMTEPAACRHGECSCTPAQHNLAAMRAEDAARDAARDAMDRAGEASRGASASVAWCDDCGAPFTSGYSHANCRTARARNGG